ncbi:hypothetical protein RCL1_006730 [Eukaryota sp. TZLM3-RCL]
MFPPSILPGGQQQWQQPVMQQQWQQPGMPGMMQPQMYPNHMQPQMQPMGGMVNHLSGFAATMQQQGFNPVQQRMFELQQKFRAIDTDGSGQLGFVELVQAFNNTIDQNTVSMLLTLFDTSRTGELNINEFVYADTLIESIRNAFRNCSGGMNVVNGMNFQQFVNQALPGLQVSPQTIQFLFQTFDKRRANSLAYNDCVKVCILISLVRYQFSTVSPNGSVASMNLDAILRIVSMTH